MSTFRIVLDTNILVSALLSAQGNPAKVYRMFLSGAITVLYGMDILAEYQDALHRRRLIIPRDDAATVLRAIRQYGVQIEPVPRSVALTDEDDRVFYDTAKAAGAYLITGNIRHYPQEPFIMTPSEFLEL